VIPVSTPESYDVIVVDHRQASTHPGEWSQGCFKSKNSGSPTLSASSSSIWSARTEVS
jgi:hypothetical protein